MTDGPLPAHTTTNTSSLGTLIKRLLFLIVLALVVWQLVALGRQIDWNHTKLHPGWLLAAAVMYLVGWLPCVWYWRILIDQQGTILPWAAAIRSHYCGHLGKYVPGKAAALLIRGEMIRSYGVPLLTGVLTAGFESLATMAVGGAVAATLAPFAISRDEWSLLKLPWMTDPTVRAIIVLTLVILTILAIPILSHILNLVMHRIVGKVVKSETTLRDMRPPRWAFLALVLTWWLHGLSLGCTIQGVGADVNFLANWPRYTAAASLGTVVGFVVLFAPGGAGVREGVLLTLLRGSLGPQAALVVVLLRLISLVSELLVAGFFLLILRPPQILPQSETKA